MPTIPELLLLPGVPSSMGRRAPVRPTSEIVANVARLEAADQAARAMGAAIGAPAFNELTADQRELEQRAWITARYAALELVIRDRKRLIGECEAEAREAAATVGAWRIGGPEHTRLLNLRIELTATHEAAEVQLREATEERDRIGAGMKKWE